MGRRKIKSKQKEDTTGVIAELAIPIKSYKLLEKVSTGVLVELQALKIESYAGYHYFSATNTKHNERMYYKVSSELKS